MGKNLVVRAISGAVLVAVMVGLIWWNEYSRFFILSLIGVAGCWEFISIIKKSSKIPIARCFTMISAISILACSFLKIDILVPIAASFLFRAIIELYRKKEKPLESMAYEALAITYTVLPMMLLYQYDLYVIFAVLIFVWTNDIGAYLVGSTLGKHRLFERISPKKSWEGFIGGFILVLIAGYFYWDLTQTQTLVYWLVVAVTISLSAVFGDLFESLLKRSVNIKDSGSIIPGHGGILDRFDALYFAAFALFLVDKLL